MELNVYDAWCHLSVMTSFFFETKMIFEQKVRDLCWARLIKVIEVFHKLTIRNHFHWKFCYKTIRLDSFAFFSLPFNWHQHILAVFLCEYTLRITKGKEKTHHKASTFHWTCCFLLLKVGLFNYFFSIGLNEKEKPAAWRALKWKTQTIPRIYSLNWRI